MGIFTRTVSNIHQWLAVDIPTFHPDFGGPGMRLLMQIGSWAKGYVLVMCVIVLVVGAGMVALKGRVASQTVVLGLSLLAAAAAGFAIVSGSAVFANVFANLQL